MADQNPELVRAQARLPWVMVGLAAGVTISVTLAGHVLVGVGFTLGAALAILNFFWLHQAISVLFSSGATRPSRRVIAKFALRYPLAFGAVYLFYRTGWLPFPAILAGLFVPVGGVLIESLFQIWMGLRNSNVDFADN
ncbi:MAG TPA: ATP synthase subunit I [Terriglobia bacterium]|nr:ATP synthase subunit I [Terriglobia bacterium]